MESPYKTRTAAHTSHVCSRRRETIRFILDAHVFIFAFKSEIGISAYIYGVVSVFAVSEKRVKTSERDDKVKA